MEKQKSFDEWIWADHTVGYEDAGKEGEEDKAKADRSGAGEQGIKEVVGRGSTHGGHYVEEERDENEPASGQPIGGKNGAEDSDEEEHGVDHEAREEKGQDGDAIIGERASLRIKPIRNLESHSEDEEVAQAKEKYHNWREKKKQERAARREDKQVARRVELVIGEGQGGERISVDGGSESHSSSSYMSVLSGGTDSDSGHDAAERRKEKYLIYDPHAPLFEFSISLCFEGPKQFKEALFRYSVKNQVDFKYDRNTKEKVTAKCKGTA